MSQPVNLQIPTPCHESWAQMKPEEQGRFCSSCSKTVVDFSIMTDRQLFEYFKNYSGGACGRFTNDQLNRNITVEKPKRTGWFKYAMSVLLPAMLFTSRSMAQGRVTKKGYKYCPPKNTTVSLPPSTTLGFVTTPMPEKLELKRNIQIAPPTIDMTLGDIKLSNPINLQVPIIKGVVKDEDGNPVSFALVNIKGESSGVSADEKGNFAIKGSFTGPVTLNISAVGFESKEQVVDPNKDNNEVKMVSVSLEYVTVGMIISKPDPPKKTVFHNFAKFITDNVKKSSFIAYPNPATRGDAIRTTLDASGTYYIQVMDANGLMVQEERLNAYKGNTTVAFYLSQNVLPGYYTLLLTNEKRKKIGAQKLIVQ